MLRRAQETAVARLRPGVTCGALYQAAADCVEKAGYGEHWVMEHIGYGVGIRQSEFYPIIAKGSAVPIEKTWWLTCSCPASMSPISAGPG